MTKNYLLRPILIALTLFALLNIGPAGQSLAFDDSPRLKAETALAVYSLESFGLSPRVTPSRLDPIFDAAGRTGGRLKNKLFPSKSESQRQAEFVLALVGLFYWALAGFTLSKAQGRRAWLWGSAAFLGFFAAGLNLAVIFYLAYQRQNNPKRRAKKIFKAFILTLSLTLLWLLLVLLTSMAYLLIFYKFMGPLIYSALVLAATYFCFRFYAGQQKLWA